MEQLSNRQYSLPILLACVGIFVVTCPRATHGHGRLIDPPARNSMWRFGFDNPVNYNDNELYCGGRMVQWLKNGGKCGVCGDSYHGDRPHEAGGKFANGIIAKTYDEGSEIDITVHLTANHLGFFEFRLCPHDDPKTRIEQSCLDKHLLERADGLGTRFFVPKGKYNAMFNYTLKLPRGLTCNQCVIQWKYRTGNTWDKENDSGRFCLGCGPQEEFYNCADISIEQRRAAVIEYPTSQPDPPSFLPTINLPTVATAKQKNPVFTKAPWKSTEKHRIPPGRRPMPPRLPHIPPPPRLPHSKTRPVNKQRSDAEQRTSIFTTAKPRTKKPTTTESTTTSTTTTSTKATTTPTSATTTLRTKPTIPRKSIKVIPRKTWRPRTRTTTPRTTRQVITNRSRTQNVDPTITVPTTKREITTKAKTTERTTHSTTPRRTLTRKRTKPRHTTTVGPQRKTTGYYKIIPRKTWRPPIPSEGTNSPTTSRKKPIKKPNTPKNPFHHLKTKQTPKSPFAKPTTKKYKYWKPTKNKYPLLKDNLELEDVKDDDKQKAKTKPRDTKTTTTVSKERTTTTQKATLETNRKTETTQITTISTRIPTTVSHSTTEPTTPTTTKSTTTISTRIPTTVSPSTTEPTTPTTTKSTTTSSTRIPTTVIPSTTKPTTPTTTKSTTTTTTERTTRKFPRRSRPTTAVWTKVQKGFQQKTRKWVKWWTNRPATTTIPPATTKKTTTPVATTTERSRTTPSLWWPPIWLPWTQAPTTTEVTTTQEPSTTTAKHTRPPVWSRSSKTPWMKAGNPLDHVFGKIGSSENLPWYIAGDFTWKTSSPTEQDNRLLEEVSKISDQKGSTAHNQESTTPPPCLISTTPIPQQRDNLVKSPFQPPRHGRRRTRPPVFHRKTPPVWFRTAIPPVVQPVQPPPPSHHLWVKKNVRTCRAIIPLSVGMNDWCFVNCNSGFCPTKFCYCENKHKRPRYRHRTKKPPLWWQESFNPRPKPTTATRPRFVNRKRVEASRQDSISDREKALQNIKQNMYRCKGIGKYSDRPEFDDWCQTNCRSVLCPLLICGCTWR